MSSQQTCVGVWDEIAHVDAVDEEIECPGHNEDRRTKLT